jgi:hypothetical protein
VVRKSGKESDVAGSAGGNKLEISREITKDFWLCYTARAGLPKKSDMDSRAGAPPQTEPQGPGPTRGCQTHNRARPDAASRFGALM